MSSVPPKFRQVWTPPLIGDDFVDLILSIRTLLRRPPEETRLLVPDVDPKFHEVMGYMAWTDELIAGLKSEKLKQICEVYRLNCERAFGVVGLLVSVAHHSAQSELRAAMTRITLGLAPDDTSKDMTREFAFACVKVGEAWAAKRFPLGHDGINALVTNDGLALLDMQVQTGLSLLKERGREFGKVLTGMQSVLGSMLLAGYAAYEALAGDVWIAALNAKPELAANYLAKNQEKNIRLEALTGYGFDLSNVMGTYLTKRGGGVTFQKLDSILEAYKHVFGEPGMSCFSPLEELRLTEKLRHLLAHRGGLIDDWFLKDVSFDPFYGKLAINSRVPLTGAAVRRHLDACSDSALKLIEFMDEKMSP